MIVFATSDKGGTGRSVTCANIAYRRALTDDDVAYVDFDFGSPTAAVVFEVIAAMRGVDNQGVHSYLQGDSDEPTRLDVWSQTDREALRGGPANAGRLCLVPGDRGGGEFAVRKDVVDRCVRLLTQLHEEFDVTIVDLSAGRSYAIDIALQAAVRLESQGIVSRWLVFHRWTRQHIVATAGLVHGERGILSTGQNRGHDREALAGRIRYVRAAVPDIGSPHEGALAEWLRVCDEDLHELAAKNRLGRTVRLGTVPLDPVLQWREQLITDADVANPPVANRRTAEAFRDLADALTDDRRWETL
ncbi:SCO2523 family variant P-loop protein [Streptomyces sp. NPDC059373]